MEKVKILTDRVEKLEIHLNKNSNNSSKPPSSDPPYKKKRKTSSNAKGEKRKIEGQKDHSGHQQKLLPADHKLPAMPKQCACGFHAFDPKDFVPYHTHQVIELIAVKLGISHYILLKDQCPHCNKTIKAEIPEENPTGYDPRLRNS